MAIKLVVLFVILTQIFSNNFVRCEFPGKSITSFTSAEIEGLPDEYDYNSYPDEEVHIQQKRRFRPLHSESNLKHLTQMIAECILVSNSCTQQQKNNLVMAVLYEKNKAYINHKKSSANSRLKIMNDFMPMRY